MMMSMNEYRGFPAELGDVSYSSGETEASLSYSSSDSESSSSSAGATSVDARQARRRRYSEDVASPLSDEFSEIFKKHRERRADRKKETTLQYVNHGDRTAKAQKPDPPFQSEQNLDQLQCTQTQMEQDFLKSKLSEALELVSSDGLVKSKLSEALELISTDGSTDETIHLIGVESSAPLISRFAMQNYSTVNQVNVAPGNGNDEHDYRSMLHPACKKSNDNLDERSIINLVDAREDNLSFETEAQEIRDGSPLQTTHEPDLYSPGRPSFQPKAKLNEVVGDDERMDTIPVKHFTLKQLSRYKGFGLMRRRLPLPVEKNGGDNQAFDPDTNSILLSEDDTTTRSPLNRRSLQRSMKTVEPEQALDEASPQFSLQYRSFSFEDDVDKLGNTEDDTDYAEDDETSCSLDSQDDELLPLVQFLTCFILSG